MTNLGLIRALESQGIRFVATPVGDRYVLEEMMAQGHTLGGEQSGHIIMRKYANTGDGLLTALHLISHVATSKKSLKELSSFMTRYPQVLINVGGVARDRLNSNKKVQEAITEVEKSLGNKGRVLLRASGTEPLIRVMIEAEDSAAATKFAESLAALVKSELAL
jgi:phosphoglucosamine mutase